MKSVMDEVAVQQVLLWAFKFSSHNYHSTKPPYSRTHLAPEDGTAG